MDVIIIIAYDALALVLLIPRLNKHSRRPNTADNCVKNPFRKNIDDAILSVTIENKCSGSFVDYGSFHVSAILERLRYSLSSFS